MKKTLDLTKDEWTMLEYAVELATDDYGEPLKDTYELGDDEPEEPEAVMKSVLAKLRKVLA